MGMFVLRRGKGGVMRPESVDPETYVSGDTPKDPVRPKPTAASEAYRELVATENGRPMLHKWPLERVLPQCSRLAAIEECERILLLEKKHPLYEGGRNSVVDQLEERMGELVRAGAHIDLTALDGPPAPPAATGPAALVPGAVESVSTANTAPATPAKPLPDTAPRKTYPCDVCGFVAATPLGASSHRRAKHPSVAQPEAKAAAPAPALEAEPTPANVGAPNGAGAGFMAEPGPEPTLSDMVRLTTEEDG